jgi:hypothetical protein
MRCVSPRRLATSSTCWNPSKIPELLWELSCKLTLSRLQILESENGLPETNKRKRPDDGEVTAGKKSQCTDGPRPLTGFPLSERQLPFVDCNVYDGRSSAYQVPLGGNKHADLNLVFWEPKPDTVSLLHVQRSYTEAIKAGHLLSTWIPRLQSADGLPADNLPANDLPNVRWDPYALTAGGLCTALLDKGKIGKLKRQLQGIIEAVPNTAEWEERTKEYGLIPAAMLEILLVAFGCVPARREQPIPANETGSKIPHILMMAQHFLGRAGTLEKENAISTQAMSIARLVGYALMRVCEVVDKLTPAQVCLI